MYSTNNQLNPSVTAILEQCMSLSTGTYVSQFVSHPQTTPEPAVNRPTMTQDRRQLAPCTQIQSEVLQGL